MSKRILVVDDEAIVGIGIQRELSHHNFEVMPLTSGEEALRCTEVTPFDIALIDLMMPSMDGVETCKRLKEKNPALRMIILSGHPSELKRRTHELLRIDPTLHFLQKPFSEGELLRHLKEMTKIS